MPTLQTPILSDKAEYQIALDSAIGYLSYFSPMSEECIAYLKKNAFERRLNKGDLLHQAGIICLHSYFVIKGVLRGYINDGNNQITTWITAENQIFSSVRGYVLQLPTVENIEALEECYILGMHHSNLDYAYAHFPEFNIVGRKIAEYYYIYAEDRALLSRLSKPVDRYNYFMVKNSTMLKRIPHSFIASYLDMSLETLTSIIEEQPNKKHK
jgi:CRP-like cAMP-binding protein